MRYPANAPIPYWLRLKERYSPTLRLRKIPLPKIAVCSTIALIGLAAYAVVIYPKLYHDYYDEIQRKNLAQMSRSREELANGLRPWSDPFDRK